MAGKGARTYSSHISQLEASSHSPTGGSSLLHDEQMDRRMESLSTYGQCPTSWTSNEKAGAYPERSRAGSIRSSGQSQKRNAHTNENRTRQPKWLLGHHRRYTPARIAVPLRVRHRDKGSRVAALRAVPRATGNRALGSRQGA